MTPVTATPRTISMTTTAKWVLMAMLFLSAVINYVDRGSLSVAAPVLSNELALNPVQVGYLLSAFFWTYAAVQIFSGWLVDRYPVVFVFAGGYLIWSIATLLCGFAGGLVSLMAFRLILGAGESVALPSYAKMIASNFSIAERGVPNSLIEAGVKVGPALGTFASGLLVASYGWRIMFWIVGGASLLWLIPWMLIAPKGKRTQVESSGPVKSPGFKAILSSRDAWGTFLGSACYTYPSYLMLTWLPFYLVQRRHLTIREVSVLAALPYVAATIMTLLSGWASDRWIKRGGSPTLVRKTFVVTGMSLSGIIVFADATEDLTVCMALIIASAGLLGIYGSNHWAITQTLAGPLAVGKWAGVKNTIGSLMGIIAPIYTGYVVKTTGGFFWAFATPAILAILGSCCYLFLIGKVAPVDWEKDTTIAPK